MREERGGLEEGRRGGTEEFMPGWGGQTVRGAGRGADAVWGGRGGEIKRVTSCLVM